SIAGVKMKKWIGISISVLALLGITVFVLFNFTNVFQASEDESLNNYVSQYESGEYAEIYESLSEETQAEYNAEDVSERYQKLYEDLGVESRSIENLELNEEKSTEYNKIYEGDWSLDTDYGELSRDIELSLLYDEGENNWYLEWTPDMIIPGLGNHVLDFNFI